MMTRTLPIMLPFALLAALAACQSTADYPAVCGDGVRGAGEACDGALIDPARDTCEELGQGTGVVHCHTDCTLDTSMCTGEFDCDPVADTGCGTGKHCYYDPADSKVECQSAGDAGEGQTCGESRDCLPRHACLGDLCRAMCNENGACESDDCATGSWPMGWGWCEPVPPPECDPVAQTGCSAPFACYISNASGELGCLPVSTGALGDACNTGAYCAPGLVCAFGYDTLCHKLCRENSECTGIGSGNCNKSIVTLEDGLGVCQ